MKKERYPGHYTSAIVRCKRVLKSAGIPLGKIFGRYPDQKIAPGIRVFRIGVSSTIALHWLDRTRPDDEAARRARREREAEALEVLQTAGLPFDYRGVLDCDPTGNR